jgi:hypothetical protein
VDHSNLHLWARDFALGHGLILTVNAMLAIMRLVDTTQSGEPELSESLREIEANLEAWLQSPNTKPPRNPSELGVFSDPQWARAPGEAILEPERLPDLFAAAVVSAREDLVVHAINAAGLDVSGQRNGALLREPRFDQPAVDSIREAAQSSVPS